MTQPKAGHRPRCLIVDDDLSFLSIVTARLQDSGFHTEVVVSGSSAISAVENGRHDVILLDIRLPDADGIDVLRQMRSIGIDAPIIMISGASSIATAVSALKIGATDFIEKPIAIVDLVALLRRLTQKIAANGKRDDANDWRPPLTLPDPVAHASVAVGTHMIGVITSAEDVPTVQAWAQLRGLSTPMLFSQCAAASVRAKACLDLARVMRVLTGTRLAQHGVRELLRTSDPRTIDRVLRRSGLAVQDLQTTSAADVLARHPLNRNVHLARTLYPVVRLRGVCDLK